MGTFNSTLFIVEMLATVVFFIVMQKGSTPENMETSKNSDNREENSEYKKAA